MLPSLPFLFFFLVLVFLLSLSLSCDFLFLFSSSFLSSPSTFYRHPILLPIFHDSDKAWLFMSWPDWGTNNPVIAVLLMVVSSTPQ
jgi:hypothetical protein